MLRKSFPIVRQVSKTISPNTRGVWGLNRPTDIQRIMRDMDRRMEAFEREFFKIPPFRYLQPQILPIEGVDNNNNFNVNIDVSGFRPEDIKISLKDGKLKIEAKMEKTENGSTIQQHLVREFTVPDNLDEKTIESFLHNNGVLTIEAAQKPGGTKIPISYTPELEKGGNKI